MSFKRKLVYVPRGHTVIEPSVGPSVRHISRPQKFEIPMSIVSRYVLIEYFAFLTIGEETNPFYLSVAIIEFSDKSLKYHTLKPQWSNIGNLKKGV